jgi:hypothetical protein
MDTSGSPGPSTPCGTTRSGRRRVTKTEIHHAEVLEKLGFGEAAFPKVQRRERREFTQEEDERLLHGFTIVRNSFNMLIFYLPACDNLLTQSARSMEPPGVESKTTPHCI